MRKVSMVHICMLAIAGITGATIAISLGMPTWTFNERGAAWVQAIGSIAAIVAAALIASQQQRTEAAVRRRESDLRAQDAAMLLFSHTDGWARRAHSWLNSTREKSGIGVWLLVNDLAEKPESFEVPNEVMAMVGNLRVLGDTGTELQRAILMSREVIDLQDVAADLWRDGKGSFDERDGGARYITNRVSRYANLIIQASREVRRLARIDENDCGNG